MAIIFYTTQNNGHFIFQNITLIWPIIWPILCALLGKFTFTLVLVLIKEVRRYAQCSLRMLVVQVTFRFQYTRIEKSTLWPADGPRLRRIPYGAGRARKEETFPPSA